MEIPNKMISVNGTLVSPGSGGVYGERMIDGRYRVWDPFRSKLAAVWYLDHNIIDLRSDDVVLYLGAANGTTVSHVSDYVESVYAVEFAARPIQDLLYVAKYRTNIIPIYGDATKPYEYAPFIESVDLIYQDVAQPTQSEIAIKHLPFLKSGGKLVLMLKTRSVDIRKSSDDVFKDTQSKLIESGLDVVNSIWLSPYHMDHVCIICKLS